MKMKNPFVVEALQIARAKSRYESADRCCSNLVVVPPSWRLQSLCENSLCVSFRGVEGDEESRSAAENFQSEIPSLRSGQALRGVYPERQSEILRSAQNDKRRARNDTPKGVLAFLDFAVRPPDT